MDPIVAEFFQKRRDKINKEIELTGKYPKSFQYLPSNFTQDSDNQSILNIDRWPIEVEGDVLKIKPCVLGVKKKTKFTQNEIPFGELYIIHALGTELYKIGISTNFCRRYRDLVAASPLPIRVLKYARMDNPHILEKQLHSKYEHNLFKNEWFQLSEPELRECFSTIDQFYNL